jgi:hypothetical protein
MNDPLYAEVPESFVSVGTRRHVARDLRTALRDADLEPRSRSLRWFCLMGTDRAGLSVLSAMPSDGQLFHSESDHLAGALFPAQPRDIWINAWIGVWSIAETVRHEVEHSRLVELTGPPRDAAEVEAHEFAASHRWTRGE